MQKFDSSLTEFIEKSRQMDKLSREEEHELAIQAQAGDLAARRRLAETHLRYVVSIAMQYRRYPIPLAELIAEGNLGLMIAIGKFDPEAGTRLVTYAGYWIRAYILDLVVKGRRMVGAGSGPLRSKTYFKLRRERARASLLSTDPADQRKILAEKFEVSEDKMRRMLERLDAHDASLDAVRADASGPTTLMDTLESDDAPADDAVAADQWMKNLSATISAALPRLDERERFIIETRHLGERRVSLADLGRELGVSRERARQLEARAKDKLRKELSAFAPVA